MTYLSPMALFQTFGCRIGSHGRGRHPIFMAPRRLIPPPRAIGADTKSLIIDAARALLRAHPG